jgi:hypothetical protein
MADLQVDIEKIGRNLYSVRRSDRENMDEEYVKLQQRRTDPNMKANDIYVLKRYKVWVAEENRDVLGMYNRPTQRMLPHINCAHDETAFDEAAVLTVLGYDPAKRTLKYSKDGLGAAALGAADREQTLHQTLRKRGLNRLHVCYA